MEEFIPALLLCAYLAVGATFFVTGGGPEDVSTSWKVSRRKGMGIALLGLIYIVAWPLSFFLPGDC